MGKNKEKSDDKPSATSEVGKSKQKRGEGGSRPKLEKAKRRKKNIRSKKDKPFTEESQLEKEEGELITILGPGEPSQRSIDRLAALVQEEKRSSRPVSMDHDPTHKRGRRHSHSRSTKVYGVSRPKQSPHPRSYSRSRRSSRIRRTSRRSGSTSRKRISSPIVVRGRSRRRHRSSLQGYSGRSRSRIRSRTRYRDVSRHSRRSRFRYRSRCQTNPFHNGRDDQATHAGRDRSSIPGTSQEREYNLPNAVHGQFAKAMASFACNADASAQGIVDAADAGGKSDAFRDNLALAMAQKYNLGSAQQVNEKALKAVRTSKGVAADLKQAVKARAAVYGQLLNSAWFC